MATFLLFSKSVSALNLVVQHHLPTVYRLLNDVSGCITLFPNTIFESVLVRFGLSPQ